MKTIIKEETLRKYAREQGWFDTVLYENVSFSIKKSKDASNMLNCLRKIFKDEYVGRTNYGECHIYTIYTGDKKTQKMLHEPIRILSPRQQFNIEFKNDMNNLRNTYK